MTTINEPSPAADPPTEPERERDYEFEEEPTDPQPRGEAAPGRAVRETSPAPHKVEDVADLVRKFEQADAVIFTSHAGLDVKQVNVLRRQLDEVVLDYSVVKNTLARRAAVVAGLPEPNGLLSGPTALAFIEADVVRAARIVRNFAREHPLFVIKGAVAEHATVLHPEDVLALADLASREEYLARLAGAMQQVLRKPLDAIRSAPYNFAGLLRQFEAARRLDE